MNYYADVILPLPLKGTFTYHITKKQKESLDIGFRVAVSFGKRKVYTGIIKKVHNTKPELYETKPIEFIYDEEALVTELQIDFWSWISRYYFTPIGDVLKAAIPSTFLLESDTVIIKKEVDKNTIEQMSGDEFLIYEALDFKNLKINEVSDIVDKKNTYTIIQKMILKDLVELNFEINEKYKPKLVSVVYVNKEFTDNMSNNDFLEKLHQSPKQKEILLQIISKINLKKYIAVKDLKKTLNFSDSSLKSLQEKGFILIKKVKIDRITYDDNYSLKINDLSENQKKVLNQIQNQLEEKEVILLDGVTSSGKTEIYIKIIESYIENNEQVLYLLPEISLTTQIIQKLKSNFGDKISVFHSKYSLNERTEVWKKIKNNDKKSRLIVGARSSIFLPFNNLGLIVVDEEHETSYKQQEPSPRYNARDSAIFLSKLNNSKVILGSATPSIESTFNAKNKKYGYVKLNERYGNVKMPNVLPIDMKSEIKHEFSPVFSLKLVHEIKKTLKEGKQVILFRNRRGYSPQWLCDSCGNAIMCDNCDVSLTYHTSSNTLKCHYCGFSSKAEKKCSTCGFDSMSFKGDGTQQIEEIVNEIFQNVRIGRMDWDSTRGKWSFEKIINSFANHEIDILIGTQMVTKGLDFKNVSLVGVLNTDHFLNFPDFRAHEKAFQILTQVAGRSGRSGEQGKVFLQTYQPDHPIIKNVINNEYDKMYNNQLTERKDYKYPPFVRIIRITIKDKSYDKLNNASEWLNRVIRDNFKGIVLGPVYPEIARIKNKYNKEFLIKLKNLNELNKFRSTFQSIHKSFDSISKFRSVRIVVDVDPI
ncbi:MAG: primosomal protein N' [Flavobacteriales bacterium]|nr:MAG: primosomal protein N' [Flavobacteriales bacterium]CAI8323022.1 MAG: Primosomal protein N' [Flavobacteriales bacterium]|tara:strand:+ start:3026 stop:5470 length:2445 start_codon:yes stop_codon:yes gene_type:complete